MATGAQRKVLTTEAGYYTVPLLLPGEDRSESWAAAVTGWCCQQRGYFFAA
jgi:hypothetical protein